MITSNFKSLLALILHASQTDNTGVAAVKDVNGSTYYATPNFTFPASTALNFTLDQAAAGVSLGSSSTAASASDYKLQSPITSGLTGTVVSTEEVTSDGPLYTIQLTVTNTSASSITIGEIGYKQHLSVSSSSGSTGTRDAVCLLDRTVLSTPVTLSGGESAVIRYKLKSLLAGSGGGGGDTPDPGPTPTERSLVVTHTPNKTLYMPSTGLVVSYAGLVVTYYDGNGNSSDVTSECTFSREEGSSLSPMTTGAAEISVRVTYSDLQTTFTITNAADPKLNLGSNPTRTQYNRNYGYVLDLTGVSVRYQPYGGQTWENVTSSCTFTPANGSTLTPPSEGYRDQTVTATYKGLTVSFTVKVYADVPEEQIFYVTKPTKTTYNHDTGYVLDLTGVKVQIPDNGYTVDVTDQCTFTPADGATLTPPLTGQKSEAITITYNNATTSFTVTVYADTTAETSIESYAYQSSNITAANFPNVTTIGSNAFDQCLQLSTASFQACTYVGKYAFNSCTSLKTISFPACLSLDTCAFQHCSILSSAVFPSCEFVGDMAFQVVDGGPSIASFPRCTRIDGASFQNCNNLKSISFPLVSYIGSGAFQNCTSLTTLSFPAVQRVEGWAFQNCSYVTTASLGSCTFLSNPFNGCYRLRSLYLGGSTVASLSKWGSDGYFNHTHFVSSYYSHASDVGSFWASIYVKSSLVTAYKTAVGWSSLSARIVGY